MEGRIAQIKKKPSHSDESEWLGLASVCERIGILVGVADWPLAQIGGPVKEHYLVAVIDELAPTEIFYGCETISTLPVRV